MGEKVKIVVELEEQEAEAFAQFLKRAGHGDYAKFAGDYDEQADMHLAGLAIQRALAKEGFAPR